MKTLEKVLSQYEVRGHLGGPAKFDREHLRASLKSASAHNIVLFWIAVCAQLAFFVFALWLGVRHADKPEVLAVVVVGGGGGLALSCAALVKFWKEKVTIDLTYALVGSLNEQAATSVLNGILDAVRKSPVT